MRSHWRMVVANPDEISSRGTQTAGGPLRRATSDYFLCGGVPASSSCNELLVLEDAIHLGCRFVQQGLRLSFAEQDAYDRVAEGGGQLVRFRMEVGRRHRLREHVFGGLVVGPR